MEIMETSDLLSIAAFLGIPFIFVLLCIFSGIMFAVTPKENVKKRRIWKIVLIILAIIAGIVNLAAIALPFIFISALMYM